MMRQKSSGFNWQFSLLGLIVVIFQCDARAVNVSNTWTMPQEGLNVFYRFFRDRISWFEADAVCQFHHANLVTVDNSFQFDATRDLLRELDVNDIVWIGLMRPQSSDRFMWSNSRALVADTGYWAESLPLMDAPLCAVIDPIRDYRWHALRCGGPETASFLCEMPVPSWADACNLKDMPNLTLQYMADTASIELIRNCQEEGLLRTMCRGKQDRERALQNLICPRERLEAQRINDITNSHFKSLQIINSIPSDNNENNDIELLPLELNYGSHFPEETQTEKNTVQRLIEQFNVDELMQADEPSNMETVSSFYKIPGLIPKPVKKSAKKALDSAGKKDGLKAKSLDQLQKQTKRLPVEMDEMMMGDQPLQGEPEMPEQFLNEEVSNEILEHLPHIKKTNLHKEDGLEKEAMTIKKNLQKSREMENKKLFITAGTTSTATLSTIASSRPTSLATTGTELPLTTLPAFSTARAGDHPRHYEDHSRKTQPDSDFATTSTTAATIGHPIHPQKPHNIGLNDENHHLHTKEAIDSSHFIPPMLMVKSHYVPPAASKHGHNDYEHHQYHQQLSKFEEPAVHLVTPTEEQTKHAKEEQHHHQPSATDISMVTASQVLDSQPTTLRNLDTSLNRAATTTEKDSSMKPITKEMEQPRNATTLIFKETHATSTDQTLRSDDFTTATTTAENIEITSLPADRSQEINKNKNGPDTNDAETHELKIPQTSQPAAETTTATGESLHITPKPYDLDTTRDDIRKVTEIVATATAAAASIIPTAQHQQEHKITTEEKLTAAKQQENKEHLQITMATTEKLAAPQTAPAATTSTDASQSIAQPPPTPLAPNPAEQSFHEIEKVTINKGKLQEGDQQNEQNKEETVVKTTETLQTSSIAEATTAATQAKETHQEAKEDEKEAEQLLRTTKTADFTPTTGTSFATTTTVKPITSTLPQIVEKSTQTSAFSTTIPTSFTTTGTPTTTTTSENTTSISNKVDTSSSSSSTISTPTTIDFSSTTQAATTTAQATKRPDTSSATTETELRNGRAESSTQTPSSTAPETTRNFMKVTTEMPYKPNRRRSLIKPETVSYMKKIFG